MWIDQLVDLQVLARHGDLAAVIVAHQWLTHDPEARQAWATMASRCSLASLETGQ